MGKILDGKPSLTISQRNKSEFNPVVFPKQHSKLGEILKHRLQRLPFTHLCLFWMINTPSYKCLTLQGSRKLRKKLVDGSLEENLILLTFAGEKNRTDS